MELWGNTKKTLEATENKPLGNTRKPWKYRVQASMGRVLSKGPIYIEALARQSPNSLVAVKT